MELFVQTPYFASVADDTDDVSKAELYDAVVKRFGLDIVTAALDPTVVPKTERAINCMNYLGLDVRKHMHGALDVSLLTQPMQELCADAIKYPHVLCDDFTGTRPIVVPSFDRIRDLMDKHFKRGTACISGSAALAYRFPELGIEPNDIDIFVTGLDFSLVRGPYGPDRLAPACHDLDDLLDTLRTEFGRYTFDDTYNSVKHGDFHVYSFGLVQIIVNTTGRNVVETFDIDAIGVCYWSGIVEPTVTDACLRAVRDRKCKCLAPMSYERYYKYSKIFTIENPMLPCEDQIINVTPENARAIFPEHRDDPEDYVRPRKITFTECDQETVKYVIEHGYIWDDMLSIICFVRCSDLSNLRSRANTMYFIECDSIDLKCTPEKVCIMNSSNIKIDADHRAHIYVKDSHNIMIFGSSYFRVRAVGSQVFASGRVTLFEPGLGLGFPNLSKFLSRRK